MAFLASCFSCCAGIPCIGKCWASCCGDCCIEADDVGTEMIEPLVAPSPAVVEAALGPAMAVSPTIANSMASNGQDDNRPLKRRSVSFMIAVPEGPTPHNSPGSPTKSIIKKSSAVGFQNRPMNSEELL